MQTFLPEPSFVESLTKLDNKRLGKQRVEVKQIYRTLRGITQGWRNHPAVKMWAGHECALVYYGLVTCDVWKQRGFRDSLYEYFDHEYLLLRAEGKLPSERPWWFGHMPFHDSHKSNLIRKYPEHYRKFWPDLPANLPYIWPKPNESPSGCDH